MSNKFFIAGLPRCRTAWLANLLTWGDSFCHHELFRRCGLDAMEGKWPRDEYVKLLRKSSYRTVGDSSSTNSYIAADLFPEAQWVLIERDCNEAYDALRQAFPGREFKYEYVSKLNDLNDQLKGKLGARLLVVPFGDIDARINEIIVHCGVNVPQDRVDQLREMRVEMIMDKAAERANPLWAPKRTNDAQASLRVVNPCWRQKPLSRRESWLLEAVLASHERSAGRNNVSSNVFLNAAVASGRYTNGLAAAISTLGGVHAPLAQTMDLLSRPDWMGVVSGLLDSGGKVPGWGNSFEKGHKDPLWARVDGLLADFFPAIHQRLESITEVLHFRGKKVYPNPSAYTAAACIVLGVPAWAAEYIFLVGRVSGWTKLIMKAT